MISAQLYLGLLKASKVKRTTMNVIAENAMWKELSKITLSGNIYERLRAAHALVQDVVVTASKVPSKEEKEPPDMHKKEPRQRRRNEVSEKAYKAMDEVYDLAQSEQLAREAQARADMYAILASLCAVNGLILRNAGEEEILDEIAELREADNKFEETTREYEARTKGKI